MQNILFSASCPYLIDSLQCTVDIPLKFNARVVLYGRFALSLTDGVVSAGDEYLSRGTQ
jgi:hypothetical protein